LIQTRPDQTLFELFPIWFW